MSLDVIEYVMYKELQDFNITPDQLEVTKNSAALFIHFKLTYSDPLTGQTQTAVMVLTDHRYIDVFDLATQINEATHKLLNRESVIAWRLEDGT